MRRDPLALNGPSVLCHLRDLPDGGSRGYDPTGTGRDTVVVVRRGDQVWVYADDCPHEGTPMAWRKDAYLDAAREHIVCYAHGALFEIPTGLCTIGPCVGQRLIALPFRIEADGTVVLLADEETAR